MRVIAGVYKGRTLRTVRGLDVRPTSDRLRETLFNILGWRVADNRMLDLCAGSGAVGIEALSRGAAHVTFVEESRRAVAAIKSNLASLGIDSGVEVLGREATSAIDWLVRTGARFDLIFLDPPYDSPLYSTLMKRIAAVELLAENGIIAVEHRVKVPPDAEFGDLRVYREVKQGESGLAFYGRT
ncbi:MAG TPA: 16S rRNA (guanine(966)-N(2))-methyltransferase RsmD [Blastocatellia bacterium]|nr:16S rRNA (guanine(966)-N(2))-methyltransferase RsmD [Blastocatellia bacterium]